MMQYLTELGLEREELLIGSSILGFGTFLVMIFFPFEVLSILFFLALPIVATITMRNFMNKSNKNLTQVPLVAPMNQGKIKFLEQLKGKINRLSLSRDDKQKLYRFTVESDQTLKEVLANEKIPCSLVGVNFGALTVTYSLKLKSFSRSNLDKLLKLDGLLCQALNTESARFIQQAGKIELEISSPVKVNVDLRQLQAVTKGVNVAVGMNSQLQPATIDLASHGLVTFTAPSRRGKTTALKSMLYLLKKSNPQLDIVVCAFKLKDWASFNNSACIILDSQEIDQFSKWIVEELYRRARVPTDSRLIVVYDDLLNLLEVNKDLDKVIKQLGQLGSGCNISTIVSTQYTKDSQMFANATARILFKPSSNRQGSLDSGFAGIGLDQLSEKKGDALLVVDGYAERITTTLVSDELIKALSPTKPSRDWVTPLLEDKGEQEQPITALALHPMEVLIEKLNGWLLEDDVFDWSTGKFTNRSEALRRLNWGAGGPNRSKLSELESYIASREVH